MLHVHEPQRVTVPNFNGTVLHSGGEAASHRIAARARSVGTVTVPQDPTKSEPTPNVAAVTVDTQDQNAARPSRTVRGAKPGMMASLFVGACLLIGALSAGVPPVPSLMYLILID